MTTIAELGFAINSEPAVQAADDLDRLVQSGTKAEQSVESLASASKQAEDRLLALARAAMQSSGYQETLNRGYEATAGEAAAAARAQLDLAASQSRTVKSTSDAAAGQDRLAASERKAAVASTEQAQALAKLLGQIDPTVAAFARLDEQQQKLAKFKAAGILPADDFTRYNSQIEGTRQKLGGFDDAMKKTGVSAALTKAALNQLPAQFTDIFTSLAGGQNPLLVLIQQGGQIKDSFGGIGPMFDALGEKFGSMFGFASTAAALGDAVGGIGSGAKAAAEGADAAEESIGNLADGANTAADASKNAAEAAGALRAASAGVGIGLGAVVTGALVAAAAAAALAIAYKQGSDEGTAYNKSLAMTGNTAGTTAEQLSVIAKAVSGVNGTVHEAAASLAQLAGSTRIPVSEFEKVATAAANFEDATDKAASETVANFEKIAKDPLKATIALNEQMNFLTVSTYEQINALVKQGKDTEAASVANTAYANALNSVQSTVNANLGVIEKAWKGVKDAAKGAWDAALNVGREDTFAEKMAELEEQAEQLKRLPEAVRSSRLFYNSPSLEDIEAQKTQLLLAKSEADRRAAAKGAARQAQQEAIDAEEAIGKVREQTQSNAERREKELAEYRRNVEKIRSANPNSALLEEKRIAQDIANINEKYADKKVKAAKAYTEAAGVRELDQAKQQEAVLNEQLKLVGLQKGEVDKLGESGKALIKWEQELADLKEKKTLTADQKSLLASQEQITAQLKRNAALEKEIALKKLSSEEDEKLLTYQKAINAELDLAQQGLSNQLAGLGLGQEGRRRLQDDLKLRQDYQKKMSSLQEQLNKGEITQDLFQKQTAMLESALDQRLTMQTDYYRQLELAQADWSNGANAAWQDYVDSAADISSQTYDLFSNAFGGMEDALVDFVTNGKLSFKSLADSIIADIARILIRTKIITPALSALFGGSGGGGGVSGLLGGNSSGGGGFDLQGAWNNVSGAYSVATSGFGQAVSAGWTAGEGFLGGVQGAIKAGAGSISAGIGSLFAGSSGTMVNGVYQLGSSAAPATVDLISNTVSNSATGAVTGTASGATSAAGAGLSASSALMAGIGGAIQGYLKAGVKGAVAGAGGAVAGAYAGAAIGTMVPVIGNVIGGAIGAVLGGMFGSSLFGGEWITKDTGFQLGVEGGDFESSAFEYQKKKGGLFSSNKKRTRLTALDPEMQAALDQTYAATLGTVVGLFDSLNVQLNDGVLDGLNIAATKISNKDKTAEEIQAEIAKWFTSLGDAAVAEVNKVTGSGLEGFNLESLTTFVNNLYSVNSSFDMIGVKMVDFNVAGGRSVENLVALSGGIEALNSNITKFYDGFTTDVQKSIDTLDGVRAQFAAMGLTLPATRAAFAEAVKGLDMTSAAERQIFASMTANAEQAAAAYTILEQRQSAYFSAFFSESENTARTVSDLTAQIKTMGVTLPGTRGAFRAMVEAAAKDTSASGKALYESLMNVASLAGQAFDAIEQQTQTIRDSLMQIVTSSQSAVQRAISAQQEKATAAYNARVTSLNDMSSTASKAVSDLTSVSNSLSNALKALRGDSDDAVKMLQTQARATLQSALATARSGGSLAGFTGLEDALSTVSSNNTDLYESMEDFARDQGRTANVVAELNALNGKQLTTAEKTVKALQDQLDQAKTAYDAQMAQFDAQLEFAQAQVDALNGVDNSVMGVTAAINAMNAAVVAALAAISGKASAGTSTNNGTLIDSVYKSLLGRDADAAGRDFWQGQLSSGAITYDQLAQAIANAAKANGQAVTVPGYATGGLISGPGTGTSDSILARLSNGEYVMSADAVRMFGTGMLDQMNAGLIPAFAAGGPVGDSGPQLQITRPNQVIRSGRSTAVDDDRLAELVTEVKGLRAEVAAQKPYLYQTTKNTGSSARELETVREGGIPTWSKA